MPARTRAARGHDLDVRAWPLSRVTTGDRSAIRAPAASAAASRPRQSFHGSYCPAPCVLSAPRTPSAFDSLVARRTGSHTASTPAAARAACSRSSASGVLGRPGQRQGIAGLEIGGDVEAAHEGAGIERRPAEALVEASRRPQAMPLLQLPERDTRRLDNPAAHRARPSPPPVRPRRASPQSRHARTDTRSIDPVSPPPTIATSVSTWPFSGRPRGGRPTGLTVDPERGAIAGSRHRNAGRARRARGEAAKVGLFYASVRQLPFSRRRGPRVRPDLLCVRRRGDVRVLPRPEVEPPPEGGQAGPRAAGRIGSARLDLRAGADGDLRDRALARLDERGRVGRRVRAHGHAALPARWRGPQRLGHAHHALVHGAEDAGLRPGAALACRERRGTAGRDRQGARRDHLPAGTPADRQGPRRRPRGQVRHADWRRMSRARRSSRGRCRRPDTTATA